MKRWAIFAVIAVIISVCLVSSYAGININSSVPQPGMMGLGSSRNTTRSSGTASSAYSAPASIASEPLDPNKVAAAVRAFSGLEQELTQVGRGSRTEVVEWLRPISSTTDNRSRLAREVQKQVVIELAFLRKIAEEEGAKKTAAAIDGIWLVRESRLKKLVEKMAEEKRSTRSSASSTRSSRRRSSRSNGTGSGTESRGRYAPSNRNKGQTSEGETGTVGEDTASGSTRRRR